MTALAKSDAEEIGAAIREIVIELAPDARFVPKYGGHVIAPSPNTEDFIGGIFAYGTHVSLEFSHGAGFDDPNGVLEGSGKARRHLKLRHRSEIAKKGARGFLTQALG